MNALCVESNDSVPALGKLEHPEPDWSLDQFGQFAKHHDNQCGLLGRKLAIHRYRQGHALALAHEKVPYGKWGTFLEEHAISKSSDDRARRLYDLAASEDDLSGLAITEAYVRFGIEKPKHAQEPGIQSVLDEPLSDDLTVLEPRCETARAEFRAALAKVKAPGATNDDVQQLTVARERWQRCQTKCERLRARQEQLDAIAAAESVAAKVSVLLDDGYRIAKDAYDLICSSEEDLALRQELGELAEKLNEIAEDIAMRLLKV